MKKQDVAKLKKYLSTEKRDMIDQLVTSENASTAAELSDYKN